MSTPYPEPPVPPHARPTAGTASAAAPPTSLSRGNGNDDPPRSLSTPRAVWAGLGAAAAFHAGYFGPSGWWVMAFPFALLPLTGLATPRRSAYAGLLLGLAIYGPHLGFFWTIFGPAAVALWLVLAFWLAAFLGLGRLLRTPVPTVGGRSVRWGLVLLLPATWTGLEYFRSELYYLRFSWLNLGYALPAEQARFWLHVLGGYGVGTLAFVAAALFWFGGRSGRWLGLAAAVALPLVSALTASPHARTAPGPRVEVAGAQIESVNEADIPDTLDRLLAIRPQAELIVLPEYSLAGTPDEPLREWCREHQRHVVVGGREPVPEGGFRNTAFVIDPRGEVVFRQAKSVPIQFFDDGLPARTQALWEFPWGKVGLAICYDLSYTRIIDRLVRQGAQLLIVPTMDSITWGAYQHRLHSRVAPLRAAEYGVPIVRVASSGISQWVDAQGRVQAEAPFDAAPRWIFGPVDLAPEGTTRCPLDRWLGPGCLAITLGALIAEIRRRRRPIVPAAIPS